MCGVGVQARVSERTDVNFSCCVADNWLSVIDVRHIRYRAALREAVNPIHVYFPSTQPIGIVFDGGDAFDPVKNQFTSVLIGDFEEDSPAPSKGLRIGDVLIAVNEKCMEGSSLHEVRRFGWFSGRQAGRHVLACVRACVCPSCVRACVRGFVRSLAHSLVRLGIGWLAGMWS